MSYQDNVQVENFCRQRRGYLGKLQPGQYPTGIRSRQDNVQVENFCGQGGGGGNPYN